MRPLALAALLLSAVAGSARAADDTNTYEGMKACTAMYEVYAYDAEAQGNDIAYRARLASSETAYRRTGTLGVQAGKSAADVKAEVEAHTQRLMDKPPQLALVRLVVQRCDAALGQTTP